MSCVAAAEWKREDVLLLIQSYRGQPVLWNVKLSSYKNRNAREIALRKVYADISKDCNNITFDQLKKIHTLRSQYKREVKLIRESKKSGAAADGVHTTKLWCFDLRTSGQMTIYVNQLQRWIS